MLDRARAWKTIWLLALLLAAPMTAEEPTPDEAEETLFRVSGSVVGSDGEPLAGVEVWIRVAKHTPWNRQHHDDWREPASTTSDETGAFTIELEPEGPYLLLAVHPEYAPRAHRDEVTDGQTVELTLAAGERASGVVKDDEGRPIPGAEVRSCNTGGRSFGAPGCLETRSDDEGRFAFDRLPRGRQYFQAAAPGRAMSKVETAALPSGDEDEDDDEGERPKMVTRGGTGRTTAEADSVLLILDPGGTVSGKVADDAGAPLVGVLVEYATERVHLGQASRASDVKPLLATHTDDAGKFSLDGLPAGEPLKLLARTAKGRPAESDTVTLEPGGALTGVTIVYERRSSATVRLVDVDEQPVAALEVLWKPVKENAENRGGGAFRLAGVPGLGKVEAGEDGIFEITGVKPDLYDITLLPEGFEEIPLKSVRLRPGKETDLGTHVVRRGVTLSGYVIDDLGAPVEGARVEGMYMKENAAMSRGVKSDAEGRFSLGGLTAAPLLQLTASADGHASHSQRGVSADGQDLEIVLERTGSVVGQGVLEDGGKAKRLEANLEPVSGGGFTSRRGRPQKARGDDDGRFEIASAPPGTYTLVLNAKDARPTRVKDVVVIAGEPTDVGTQTLEPGRSLSGVVLDRRDDSPIARAGVRVSAVGGSLTGRAAVLDAVSADDEGRFTVGGLGEGKVEVRVEHPDYAPAREQVTLKEDEPVEDLTLRLGQGGLLRGTVIDDNDLPSPDRMIGVMGAGGSFVPETTVRTNSAGEYRLERVSAGSYRVMLFPDTSAGVIDIQQKSATIREGEETVVDFGGGPKIAFEGRVTRGGRPVGDVMVMLVPGDTVDMMRMKTATADMNGRFDVQLDNPGAYNVIVTDPEKGMTAIAGQAKIVVPDEPSVSMEIALAQGSIAGSVTDEEGQPIPESGVTATLQGTKPGMLGSGSGALVGGDGVYRVDGLAEGTYVVSAQAEGYETASRTVNVGGGGDVANVEFQLVLAGKLRGRVVDANGNGIAGAIVFARASGAPGGLGSAPAESDSGGRFLISAPTSGACDIEAVARGYAPGKLSDFVPPRDDEGPEALVTLTQGGRLVIRVVDAAGNPVEGTQPALQPDDLSQAMTISLMLSPVPATGPDGAAVAANLAGGGYTVSLPERPEVAPQAVSLGAGGEATVTLRLP